MSRLHLVYATSAALALLLALVSSRLRRLPVTGPVLGLLLGLLLGPHVLGLVEVPDSERDPLLLEGTRALLAVSLVGVALRFPLRDARRVLRPTAVLVLLVMPVSALLGGVAGALLLGLPLPLAALLGACLCPTDPVLASGVVSGGPAEQQLPARLRQVLTEESGANDGLALPLVLLALALAPASAEGLGGRALESAYQVLAATVVGVVVGLLTGRGLRRAEAREDVEAPSELVLTLLMAFAALGAARLLRSDGVLAAFVAGLAYNGVVGARDRQRQDSLDEAANRYLVVPLFLLVGTVLPLPDWRALGPGAVGFVAAVLLVRRPLPVLLLARPVGLRARDAAFAGWFGPMGVSAVFYLALGADEGVTDLRLFAAGTLAVAASTVAHGVSAVPLRQWYARTTRQA